MAIKILPSSEVRDKMAAVIEEVKKGGGPCFVTQYGKVVAVFLDIDQYNALIEIAEDYEDIVDMTEAKAHHTQGEGISFEDYLKENKERLAALKDPALDKTLGS